MLPSTSILISDLVIRFHIQKSFLSLPFFVWVLIIFSPFSPRFSYTYLLSLYCIHRMLPYIAPALQFLFNFPHVTFEEPLPTQLNGMKIFWLFSPCKNECINYILALKSRPSDPSVKLAPPLIFSWNWSPCVMNIPELLLLITDYCLILNIIFITYKSKLYYILIMDIHDLSQKRASFKNITSFYNMKSILT